MTDTRPPAEDRPELLSPAGNWDCARAAVAAGADAIYFGLPDFNARLRADNFTTADLAPLMDYLHRHGVRGFVAMNTLIFPGELTAAEARLREIAAAGVDALIIQDLGLAWLARHIAPHVELHASTQMTLSSPEGLAYVESLFPLERAVLARELSVAEIRRFRQENKGQTHTPLEVFVHGALCVAYSGQCLTSESLGQRSANRGECAQACRMPYDLVVDGKTRDLGEVRYLLSPQDLAAVDLLPELVRAGVRSFKIEGRLKSPEYVAAVTRVYRKALDAALHNPPDAPSPVSEDDRYALEMTFSRGLTTGWLGGTNHPYLTHGRFGKKRGPLIGRIAACGHGWVELESPPAVSLIAGDGVVFDAGEDRNLEQGARILAVEGLRLRFHKIHSGLDFQRIRPGQSLCKTSDPRLDAEIRRFWRSARPAEKRQPLHLHAHGAPGAPLVLQCGEISVASATPLESATRHPLDHATLTAQLGRLGGTGYELASLTTTLDGPCHLPLSQLNQLRRSLVEKLDARQGSPAPPRATASLQDLLPPATPAAASPQPPQLAVLVRSPEQLAAASRAGIPTIYCDFEDPRRYREAVEHFRSTRANPAARILLATPRILKPGESGYLRLIERAGADGLLLRNLGALHHFRHRHDLLTIGDFSLNVANPLSARILLENSALARLTVSYDLNIRQALDLLHAAPPDWFELTLHQHMPLFHMEHCVFCVFLSKGTSYKDCGRPCETHTVHLRDRVGQLHRLQADVGCRNTLFNGRAQSGARHFPALRAAGLRHFRIELLEEDARQSEIIIQAYQNLLSGTANPENLPHEINAIERLGVTEGTLEEKR